MKYYIKETELETGKYDATSKARLDAEAIFADMGYKEIKVSCRDISGLKLKSRASVYFYYLENYRIWRKKLTNIKPGDIVIIQYPLQYPMLFFSKILKFLKANKVYTIALIHDLGSLRYLEHGKRLSYRIKYEENIVLKLFDKVIVHNASMARILIDRNFLKCQIVILKVFDYLVNSKTVTYKNLNRNMPIVIAGNLLEMKAGYLYKFEKPNDLYFNLYGKGFDENKVKYLNYQYKGAFLPEELLNVIEGSFGLVWDGTSLDTCDGSYGQYIRYNNPHKLSLYLAAGIPIIIWSKAALAPFVTENNLGIAVDSLFEAPEKINSLTDGEYDNIRRSVERFSSLVHDGYFLKKAISAADNTHSI